MNKITIAKNKKKNKKNANEKIEWFIFFSHLFSILFFAIAMSVRNRYNSTTIFGTS